MQRVVLFNLPEHNPEFHLGLDDAVPTRTPEPLGRHGVKGVAQHIISQQSMTRHGTTPGSGGRGTHPVLCPLAGRSGSMGSWLSSGGGVGGGIEASPRGSRNVGGGGGVASRGSSPPRVRKRNASMGTHAHTEGRKRGELESMSE